MPAVSSGDEISTVVIYDDDQDHRESIEEVVHDANYKPVVIKKAFRSLEQCLSGIKKYDAAILDHRLSPGNFGSFKGAEVVQELYRQRFPALLVTAWSRGDPEDLQPFRRQLASVIAKTDIEPETIRSGFQLCVGEFREEYALGRRPTRTIVRIASDFDEDSRMARVEAFIPSWDPRQGVTFPVTLVPEPLRGYLKTNVRFFADVNTGADSQDELFFENFELAPEPKDDLASLLHT